MITNNQTKDGKEEYKMVECSERSKQKKLRKWHV